MTPEEARALADLAENYRADPFDLADALSSLADQVEALQKDADRYRWLVNNAYIFGYVNPTYPIEQIEDVALWMKGNVPMDKEGVDEAIDRAREKT